MLGSEAVNTASENMDFSANISANPENLFQTDRDLRIQAAWAARRAVSGEIGSPAKLASKALALALAPSGSSASNDSVFVAQAGHVVQHVDVASGEVLATFRGHTGPVTAAAVEERGDGSKSLWTGSWDKTIREWDATTGEEVQTVRIHTDFVKKVLVDAGAQVGFSCSSDRTICRFDLRTGRRLAINRDHTRPVDDLAFVYMDHTSVGGDKDKEDGVKLLLVSASSDGTIRLWDPETLEAIKVLHGHDTSVHQLHVTPEGTLWSVSADKTARRWDVDTGECVAVGQHPDFVKTITTFMDGRFAVTGCRDGNVRILDGATAKEIVTIPAHHAEVSCVSVRRNRIYSVSHDQTIRHWDLTAELVADGFKLFREMIEKQVENAIVNNGLEKSTKANGNTDVVAAAAVSPREYIEKGLSTNQMTEDEERELQDLLDELEDD